MSYSKKSCALASIIVAGLSMVTGCATDATDSAPQQAEQTTVGPKVAFTEAYSDKGAITVYENDEGELSLSITGAIGIDDEQKADLALGQASLVETYRVLKGGDAKIPAGLQDLSDRYANQKAAAHADATADANALPAQTSVDLQAADGLTKDFYSDNCQTYWDYNGGNYKYTPIFCQLATCPNAYQGNCVAAPTSAIMRSADRSYAYNGTSVYAKHFLVGYQAQTLHNIPPGVWDVAVWSFTGLRQPTMTNQTSSGTLWNTVHQWSVVIY